MASAKIESKEKGISLLTVCLFTTNGAITADVPRIKRVLVILDPIMFPRAIPVLPRKLAKALTINSGADVPKATTVKPITKVEILNFLATEEDPSTTISAPLIKKINPKIKRIIVVNIIYNLFFGPFAKPGVSFGFEINEVVLFGFPANPVFT